MTMMFLVVKSTCLTLFNVNHNSACFVVKCIPTSRNLKNKQHGLLHKQQGFSLVELMLAQTLMLVVLVNIYHSMNSSLVVFDDLSQQLEHVWLERELYHRLFLYKSELLKQLEEQSPVTFHQLTKKSSSDQQSEQLLHNLKKTLLSWQQLLSIANNHSSYFVKRDGQLCFLFQIKKHVEKKTTLLETCL